MSDITTACRDINELTPTAQQACKLFLERCAEKGLKVRITETYRSQERQNYLYEQGRTRPGNKVTWTKNSRHTGRRAWDICQNIKGKEYSDAGFFVKCGKIAEKLGITWGGTWKQADTPHFEIDTNWTEQKEDNAMTQQEREKFNALVEAVENLSHTVDKLADRIRTLENPMIYNYIDENMPLWARDTIQKLVDKGLLVGDENGLHLTDNDLKQFVINDRAGLYD
nr:MAG TPA: hypothetical protein [Caudoviricetes sp.]